MLFLFHILDLTHHSHSPGKCPLSWGWWIGKAKPDKVGFVHCWLYFLPDHIDKVIRFNSN